MRHQCSNCSGEFFDDDPSSSPPARVFCVFCGTPLSLPAAERSSAVPFSPDFAREASFALGVITAPSSDFPDTLKPFPAGGELSKPRIDSLSPLEHQTEPPPAEAELPPWRLRKFWTSLAVGFGVGAVAAAVLGQRAKPQAVVAASAASAARLVVPPPAAPPLAISGCPVVPAAAPLVSAEPVVEKKPAVTPVLEKRFWLERARSAQHQYRLDDAERFYRRVLAASPRDSEALAGVGEVELLRGARTEAGAKFREALEANADYLPALVALADLHWDSGQTEQARGEYRHIVDNYSADLFPPYVSQRLEADACAPQCQ